MTVRQPPERPALVPGIAVLVGVAIGASLAPAGALASLALAAGAGWALGPRRRSVRHAFLALTFACAGAASGAVALERANVRSVPWLPTHGGAVEIPLVGEVLRAPERDRREDRWLRVAVRPERDPRPGAPPAVASLVVRGAAEGTTIDRLRYGDRVRLFARVRAVAAPRREGGPPLAGLAWGIDASGSVKSARLVEVLARGPATPRLALDRLLSACRRRLDAALGPDDEARHVAAAMLLGDRGGMDPEGLRALRDSGLFHLLAISGLNVGLVLGAALALLRRTRLPGWPAFALAALGIWAFGTVVGADPPVTRACAAAAFALFGRTLGREGDPLNTLALVAAALALLDPPCVFHPGFQLTFAATAALIALTRPLAEAIPLPRPLAYALGASAAAYAATAPILAIHFSRLAPIGLLTNLAAGPLCAAVLGSGTAALGAGELPIAGPWAAEAVRASVSTLDAVARRAAGAPFATVTVAAPPGWLVAFLAGALVVWWRKAGEPGSGRRLAGAAALLALLALHVGPPPRGSGPVEVAVLDVGQGQAVAVRGAEGACLLLDGGGSAGGRYDAGERIVAPWLAAWGCRRLEAVVLSHAHDDHAGGLASVLRAFDVGDFWIGAGAWREEPTRHLAALARERGGRIRLAVAGSRGRPAGIAIEILHPATGDAALPINDRCAVARIDTADGRSLLVPGDLERTGEDRLLARGGALGSEALVAGHHGAAASTSSRWLAAVLPRVAVVSAGAGNRFGHPAGETLARLRRIGAVVRRTDRDGSVVLREESGGWRLGEGALRGRTGTGPE